jgi:hypothetical protein
MGLEGLDKKLQKLDSDENSIQEEKLTCTHIHKSILIIDCHWDGFGGMGDKFDLIIPLMQPYLKA